MNADRETLELIEDIGQVMAESINDFFSNLKNREIIELLRKYELPFRVESNKDIYTDEFFSGKTFVLTGALKSLPRNEASEQILSRGGKIASSVSTKTDYVIVGSDPGSKYYKALDLKISILNEKEFLEHINREKL